MYVALGSEVMSSFFAVVIRLVFKKEALHGLCGGFTDRVISIRTHGCNIFLLHRITYLKLLSIVVSVFCDMRKYLKTLTCASFSGFE